MCFKFKNQSCNALDLAQVIIKEGFIISSKMLKDHLCDSVTTALEQSIQRLKPKGKEDVQQARASTSSGDNSSDSE